MKWFKQLSLILINTDSCPSMNVFEEKLRQHGLPILTGLSKSIEGFVPAYSFMDNMIFEVNGSWKIRLKKEEKLLPSYVVNDELEARIEEIEKSESRQVSAKEKRELKLSITDELLPKAFVKQSFIDAIYKSDDGFLLINQATESKREQFVSQLREALGGLDTNLPNTKTSVTSLMTSWLMQGHAEGSFTLDDFCELKSVSDTTSVLKLYKHNLLTNEIQDMVKSNRFVSQLALIWNDKLRLILCHDFTLKNIQFIDLEDTDEVAEDEVALASVNQIIMSENLSQIYTELIGYLGGIVKE